MKSDLDLSIGTAKCKTCKKDVARSLVDGEWCHVDDEYIYGVETRTITKNVAYHPANPDFIDVEEANVDETSEGHHCSSDREGTNEERRSIPKRNHNPFGILRKQD